MMISVSNILEWITKYIPISLDGWHRIFSVFTVIMMPISLFYSYSLPDLPQRKDEGCYLYDAMVVWIECDSGAVTLFWNAFHPFFSLYVLIGTNYFPLVLLIYISAYRGICIIGYKVIVVIGNLLRSQIMIDIKNFMVRIGKKEIF